MELANQGLARYTWNSAGHQPSRTKSGDPCCRSLFCALQSKNFFSPRQKYVDLYVDFVFNKSVKKQFSHFSRGFSKGCPLDVWSMFHPEELQELLHGSPKYEWKELQQVNTRDLPIYDVLNML